MSPWRRIQRFFFVQSFLRNDIIYIRQIKVAYSHLPSWALFDLCNQKTKNWFRFVSIFFFFLHGLYYGRNRLWAFLSHFHQFALIHYKESVSLTWFFGNEITYNYISSRFWFKTLWPITQYVRLPFNAPHCFLCETWHNRPAITMCIQESHA